MKWRPKHSPPPAVDDRVESATLSDETRRAKEAAARAGRQLAEVRAQAPKAAAIGAEIDDLNRHNGFYLLIRSALGS